MTDEHYLRNVLIELYWAGYDEAKLTTPIDSVTRIDKRVQAGFIAYRKLAKRFGVPLTKEVTDHPAVQALLKAERRRK